VVWHYYEAAGEAFSPSLPPPFCLLAGRDNSITAEEEFVRCFP